MICVKHGIEKLRTSPEVKWRCRECNAEYARRWYENNKELHVKRVTKRHKAHRRNLQIRVIEYLKINSCVDCSESDFIVLQFDHVRGKKTKNISDMIARGYAWDTILEEIAKCEVRCANCHVRRTAVQRKSYRSLAM